MKNNNDYTKEKKNREGIQETKIWRLDNCGR